MRASSFMLRSPTPVPASIRMSWSSNIEVVRKSPPIPPLHPSILSFIAPLSLLVRERERAVPVLAWGIGAQQGDALDEHFGVEHVSRRHFLQVEQLQFGLIPVLRTIQP